MLVCQPMPSGVVLLFLLIFNSHGSSPTLKMMLGYDLPINQGLSSTRGWIKLFPTPPSCHLAMHLPSNINDLCIHILSPSSVNTDFIAYTLPHYLYVYRCCIIYSVVKAHPYKNVKTGFKFYNKTAGSWWCLGDELHYAALSNRFFLFISTILHRCGFILLFWWGLRNVEYTRIFFQGPLNVRVLLLHQVLIF